ncbi:RibD family protein [Rhizobium sp. L1K21]|uniref:RibD family protein n=1 Tax=Rhizobium sp. L1K21 TaxID=2954933 RepID=UPI002093B73D|nr:RibD family protein [Rhizobium sp. L1K21]MCO6184630.1 RibD family protein [Rhizobium sp. L1K21]
MQEMDISDDLWRELLALRDGAHEASRTRGPAYSLYSPVANARGPFVLAQVGQSLDGRVATPAGDARDISGPDGLAHLHRCRALVDAVIVGVTTVKMDDPSLSVRIVEGPSPVRVVIDCHAQLDGSEGLFRDEGAPVIVLRSADLEDRPLPNAEVIKLRCGPEGIAPADILEALSRRALHRILVEGGARTIARFIEAGALDRLHVAVTPLIIGSGPTGIALPPIEKLSAAHRPVTTVYALGSDILFDCDLRANRSSGGQSQQIEMPDLA